MKIPMSLKISEMINPNRRLSANSIVWYLLALVLMLIAIAICLSEDWQTEGVSNILYDNNNVPTGTDIVSPPIRFSMRPHTTSIIWACAFYISLLIRRVVCNFSNPCTFVLLVVNIFFAASLIEAFIPAQEIHLFADAILGWKGIPINPQQLLMVALLFNFIGMRALSGLFIIVLGIAFISRVHDVNINLGMHGSLYVLCGFLSLMIQAKLPYMIPEGGWGMALLQDFGAIRIAAARNVAELQSHVQTAAVVAASVASGMPPSVQLDSGNARQIVRESDAVKL